MIENIQQEFNNDLEKISILLDIENIEIKYLGRKGKINDLFSQMKDPKTEGKLINNLKKEIEEKITNKKNSLFQNETSSIIDSTLPGKKVNTGSLHLVTTAIEEISNIFEKLGFIRMSYPEIEYEFFSFEGLNMPKNHPARDDFETFFIDLPESKEYGKIVLTPHTSSGQIREMLRTKTPPIKMINIGKTYRPNWDVTHVPMFHQFEGLCVGEGINLTNLKGTIEYYVHEFFGKDRKVRYRPYHFQFTEPSFELDVSCDICSGTGIINGEKCKVCKSGWLELGGAGMVHPNVLKACNMDSEKYSGWALGFGIERNFMMKQGLNLNDIRVIYNGDIRFLEQF